MYMSLWLIPGRYGQISCSVLNDFLNKVQLVPIVLQRDKDRHQDRHKRDMSETEKQKID